MTRLPHLIKLVRQYRYQQLDEDVVEEMLKTAQDLYKNGGDSIPVNIIEYSSNDEPRDIDTGKPLLESWYHFDSVFDFTLALKCYMHRLTICGIIQRLHDMGLASKNNFDIAQVAFEEMNAAECIVKCSRYALDPCWAPPWPGLRYLLAIEAANGTWSRLEKKCNMINDAGLRTKKRAAQMKQHCIVIIGHILRDWDGADFEPHLESVGEMLVGGPLPPVVSGRPPRVDVYKTSTGLRSWDASGSSCPSWNTARNVDRSTI